MKKTKLKLLLAPIKTRAEANTLMTTLVARTQTKCDTLARRDAEILAISQRYETQLDTLGTEIEQHTDALRRWLVTHPAVLPAGRKSLALASGSLGYRTTPPKLALLDATWTWEKVTTAVAHLLPKFIRQRPELDKDAILSHRTDLESLFAHVGIKVTQSETFFITPKLTTAPTRQTQMQIQQAA